MFDKGIVVGIGSIGIPGLILILILIIALIIFCPQKLPEIGSAFGKTLSEFKKSSNTMIDDTEGDYQKKEE